MSEIWRRIRLSFVAFYWAIVKGQLPPKEIFLQLQTNISEPGNKQVALYCEDHQGTKTMVYQGSSTAKGRRLFEQARELDEIANAELWIDGIKRGEV